MASTIQIKHGTGSAVPSSLLSGELALNVSNGKLYYGTSGSSNAVSSSFEFDKITVGEATITQLTSSIVSSSIVYSSGSNIFGDASADTHTFKGDITASNNISSSRTGTISAGSGSYHILQGDTSSPTALSIEGHITASGNISSSGTIVAQKIKALGSETVLENGNITASGNISASGNIHVGSSIIGSGTRFYPDNALSADHYVGKTATTNPIIHANGGLKVTGNITSSGDISSSGVFRMGTPDARQEHYLYGRLNVIGSDVTIGDGNITASGNVEIEGNISASAASTASFSHIITSGDTIEFKTGGTRLGSLKFSETDGLQVVDSSGDKQPSTPGLTLYKTGSHTSAGTTATGEIVKFGNTGTTAGSIYYLENDGTWALARANNVSTSTGSLAVAINSNSTTHGMLLRGMIKLSNDPRGGIGQPLYLSDTNAGRALNTVPDSNNDVARVIGYYMSGSGTIYFNPDNTWVKVTV